jgi:hypothetical protein
MTLAEIFRKPPPFSPDEIAAIVEFYKSCRLRGLFGTTDVMNAKVWEISDEVLEEAMKLEAPPPKRKKKSRKPKAEADPRQIDLEEILARKPDE